MKTSISKLALTTLAVSTLALTACSNEPEPAEKTVGQKIDATIADTKAGVAEMKSKAEEMAGDAKTATAEAGSAVAGAVNEAGQAVSDTSITAQVKAKLIAADQLDGSAIDVSTTEGRVTLSGTVANEAARALAAELAQAVAGVKSVDNQLTAQG